MSYHARLKELREKTGFNQADFCKNANSKGFFITVRRYRQIEAGKAKLSLNEFATIVKALGVSADALIHCDAVGEIAPTIMGKKDRRSVARVAPH